MPNIITGNVSLNKNRENIKKAEYDYNYPEDMDLRPGSEKHDKIRDDIIETIF